MDLKLVNGILPLYDTAKKVYFICIGIEGNNLIVIKNEKGRYVKDIIPYDVNSMQINSSAFSIIEMYCKITSTILSSKIFSERQRRDDHSGSVLRILEAYPNEGKNGAFSLISNREDQIIILMDASEVKVIFPRINKIIDKNLYEIKENDTVYALKNNKCGRYKKGDLLKVKEVCYDEENYELSFLILETNEKESIFSYIKEFKKYKKQKK